MFVHQTTSFRRAFPWCAGLTALLALNGCTLFGHHESAAPAAPLTAPSSTAATTATTEPQTVTSNLPDVSAEPETTTVIPDVSQSLSASAPKSYVVQRGDTLWGLARMFLKDPWLWPEIWYLNPEVANPHRIYPGDTLRLAQGASGASGAPQLVVTHGAGSATRLEPLLRSTELEAPIASIPYSAIAAFLSRPGVITKEQVKAAPYVLSLRDKHLIAGAGNDVYVSRLRATEGERYSVMHVGERLKDPDGGGTLGYLANYAGAALVTRAGDPARARINESAREVLSGDVLVPEVGGNFADFVPHAPTAAIDGRILAVVNGVLLAGQYQVVAINRGSLHGLEPGHVLRVNESPKSVRDGCARIQGEATCTHFGGVRLPAEAAGTLLVFRVYERVSYALVASETNPLSIGDHVVTP
jgi:LysM repeat protein